MRRTISLHLPLLSLLLAVGCATEPPSDTEDRNSITCLSCGVCAIASFDGPAYYAHNFQTYDEAKKWLSSLGGLTAKEIVSGYCDAPLACPDVYQPLCGQVSGSEQTTFGNACELLAATRHAAGTWPPGAAKGSTLHAGACEDPCGGKQCGEECPSMFGSPLPTYCDAEGACRPGNPVCESTYNCDQSEVLCDALVQPTCDPGYTPSVVNSCYGPCVPVDQCKCEPKAPTDCPDGYVCYASTNRCGPYVSDDL